MYTIYVRVRECYPMATYVMPQHQSARELGNMCIQKQQHQVFIFPAASARAQLAILLSSLY